MQTKNSVIEYMYEKLNKDNKYQNIVNSLYKMKNNFDKYIYINIHNDNFNNIARVMLKHLYYNISLNTYYLKDINELSYALLHELLHINLLHFVLDDKRFSNSLNNIISDIEVNMYIDLISDFIPKIHYNYIDSIEYYNNLHKRSVGFFAYIISLNYITKEMDLKEFVKRYLYNLSVDDKIHWLEFQKRRMLGKINREDIIDEVFYWYADKSENRDLINAFDWGNGGGYIIEKHKKTISREYARKYNKQLNKLRNAMTYNEKIKIKDDKYNTVSVIAKQLTRKNYFEISCGIEPLFYKWQLIKPTLSNRSLSIYIDVSASMFDSIPYTITLIKFFADLQPDIYVFSIKVKKFRLKTFLSGEYFTQFGTNMNNVLKHILKEQKDKAIIITDAKWYIKNDIEEKLIKRGVKLYFVIFNNNDELNNKIDKRLIGDIIYINN